MNLLIFTICHNESETIKELISRMPTKIPGIKKITICLIDDGSTDDTAKIAKSLGIRVESDGAQKRLATRFRQALSIAIEERTDIMVNIDGDLQFSPEDIPKLVKPIVDGEADFVAADRFTAKDGTKRKPDNMPAAKYYGNLVGAAILGWLSGQKFNDVTCGFRAYNKTAITKLNINGDFTYTQESFQVLAMKKVRIKTIPINVKYFKGRKSRVVTSIPKFVATNASNIIRSYRDFAPLKFFGLLGFPLFILGMISLTIFTIHWLFTGSFSPFKFLGFTGGYLVTMSIIFWLIGLSADMNNRILNNQEKILELLKQEKYEKKK